MNTSFYERLVQSGWLTQVQLMALMNQEPADMGTDMPATSGSDTLVGSEGGDTQFSGLGDDVILGFGGNDLQRGGSGDDILDGGAGNDRQFGGSGNDAVLGADGDDRIVGINGNDVLYGGDGRDVLFGGAGDDSLSGGAGDDRLLGGAGNDLVLGGSGDDRLSGRDGDDVLEGGAGNDRLNAGNGADQFVFGVDDGNDVILDFRPGEDKLVLKGADGTFDDLSIEAGANQTLLTWGQTTLILRNVAPDDITVADIVFEDADPADPSAIVLPDFATVIDVADFGIIADDGLDDTAAIQELFNTTSRVTYFFGDGVYDISDTIVMPDGLGTSVPSFITIQGESEAGTVFKLQDDLDLQGPILGSEGNVAQAFNNRIRDVTFDIGTGNTNAVGLQFAGNNQSTIKDVTIRSGEGGAVGLDLVSQSEFGPALIEDVSVEGFQTGISMAFQGNSVTLEDITLRGQEIGISSNQSHVAFLNEIDYEGPGTGVANNSVSRMVLANSDLRSSDLAVEDQAAVTSRWSLYVQNLQTEGFDLSIDTTAQGFISNNDIIADDVDEYIYFGTAERLRGGAFSLFENSSETGLGLQVRDTPETVWNAEVGTWVDVRDFGAVEGEDASVAFQAAIDSGATTVYVPDGTWTLDSEVVLRGNVEQVLSSGLARLSADATLRVADGTAETVIIEGINGPQNGRDEFNIQHDSDRTLVLRDLAAFSYEAAAESDQGDVFLANVVAGQTVFRDQNVWARQLNVEGDNVAKGIDSKVVNDGAKVWILGLKTEGSGTTVKTVNDGQTELLGSFHNGSFDATIPRFITEDASLWAAIVEGSTSAQDFDLVRETRNGETREANLKSDGNRPDVYSAFDPQVIADRVIIVDNDAADLTGDWQDAGPAFPGNFLGSNFLFADADSGADITYNAVAQASGTYALSLRLIDDRSGQLHSGHADAVDVTFGVGDDVFVFEDVDMRNVQGPWQQLGQISVEVGQTMFISFDADGVNGKVIADAAMFERVLESDADMMG